MPSVELSKVPGVSAARAVSPGERAQVEARTSAPAVASTARGISLEVGETGADAATVPVDGERVAEIRKALSDGSYPLVPTRIVDAMIAAQVSFAIPERS